MCNPKLNKKWMKFKIIRNINTFLCMIDLDFLDQSFQFIVFYLMRRQIFMIPNWALGHISRKRIWKSIGSSFSFSSTKLSLVSSLSYCYRVTLIIFFQKFCCHPCIRFFTDENNFILECTVIFKWVFSHAWIFLDNIDKSKFSL